MNVRIKRVYDAPEAADGTRILVDRLWPRGLTKQKAQIDIWLKDVAPSSELRTWFGHDPAKWEEFQARYVHELDSQQAAVQQLRTQIKTGPTTFVYGAKDTAHTHALVLKNYLEDLD
jgi:uncharacterized protein YeaO (DUF488 family)